MQTKMRPRELLSVETSKSQSCGNPEGATRGLKVFTDGSSYRSRCLTHLEHIATNLDNNNVNNSSFKF